MPDVVSTAAATKVGRYRAGLGGDEADLAAAGQAAHTPQSVPPLSSTLPVPKALLLANTSEPF